MKVLLHKSRKSRTSNNNNNKVKDEGGGSPDRILDNYDDHVDDLRNDDDDVGDESAHSCSSSSSELESPSLHTSTYESTTVKGSGGASVASKESSLSMASMETRWVFRLKSAVLIMLMAAAITCGVMTYLVVQKGEINDFHMEFLDYATEIADVSHQEAYNMIASVNALSATITDSAMSTKSTFPNVTLRNFDALGILSNNVSKVLQVTFAPLVARNDKHSWELYSKEHQDWIDESHALVMDELIANDGNVDVASRGPRPSIPTKIHSYTNTSSLSISNDSDGLNHLDTNKYTYAPVWQQSLPPYDDPSVINLDLLSHPVFQRVFHGMWETQKPVLSEAMDLTFLFGAAIHDDGMHPHSFLMEPIYPTFGRNGKNDLVGILVAVVAWDIYFSNILHQGAAPIDLVLHGTCGEHFTYQINGAQAIYLGSDDLHNTKYDAMEFRTPFASFLQHNYSGLHEHCEYDLRIFPSAEMENHYMTRRPILFAGVVVLVFACTTLVFLLFDFFVVLRQNKIVAKAKRTHAIVSSLFPSNVRDRLLQDQLEQEQQQQQQHDEDHTEYGGLIRRRKVGNHHHHAFGSRSARWNDVLGKASDEGQLPTFGFGSAPIADFFPSTTIMFADIVGFTAWSSTREPTQVFTLLEILYHAFDEFAKRRRVFKVETIGDCYVAVAGLPDPRPDHAVVMARFARDCRDKSVALFKQLETTLGPDTGDLSMRFGLHSGPVTAGVLRGDKGRFQLFGDTVNTASRMESTGSRNRIQCSQETADFLIEAGKKWHCPREDRIYAKGKGELSTYWLEFGKTSNPSTPSRHTGSMGSRSDELSLYSDDKSYDFAGPGESVSVPKTPRADKIQRLIDWNMDVLCRLLRQVVAHNASKKASLSVKEEMDSSSRPTMTANITSIVDEVVEVIPLPETQPHSTPPNNIDDITLPAAVIRQVHAYITTIAGMYPDNPFHNFEHASHVMMSVMKLMSRIVAPSDELVGDDKHQSLHDDDNTYGINSDPLTQFACAFCALIHDVDHPGVPNSQLVKEQSTLAIHYNNKSVAEQNSVQLAWDYFYNDPAYTDFRTLLCPHADDMRRFRQLVVNLVMATDIMDADFKKLRELRWNKAFQHQQQQLVEHYDDTRREHVNRKATIVLEHIIQASDISHTMQHWHIYRKWNERFFQEMRRAYCNGRSDKDPAEFWYQGEIGFFDFYIIPLAKKLKDCGVFGVSSDEYLNYAQKNREEWVLRGKEVVARMVENFDAIDRVNNDRNVVVKPFVALDYKRPVSVVANPRDNNTTSSPSHDESNDDGTTVVTVRNVDRASDEQQPMMMMRRSTTRSAPPLSPKKVFFL